jgi:NinB protein
MRITRTIRKESRDEIVGFIMKARDGMRVTFEDPEGTSKQEVKLRLMLMELAHHHEWHGEKLHWKEWRLMFLAVARQAHVVPGIEDGTRVVLFERGNDEPSIREASDMIELLFQFAAEHGFKFEME